MPRHPDTVITSNVLLREARKRLPSLQRVGQCMSRAELADAVNRALDQLYSGRDLTAHYVDPRWIGKLERGEHRWPSNERRAALRAVLGAASDTDLDLYSPRRTDASVAFFTNRALTMSITDSTADGDVDGGTLAHQALAAGPAWAARSGEAGRGPEVEQMQRRGLLTGLAAVGMLGWGSPVAAEAVRHSITQSAGDGDRIDLDDWERIAWDYGTAFATTPPQQLLEDLAVDLTLAQRRLAELSRETDQRTMYRVIALLCALTAETVSDLGSPPAVSRRWWRTATQVADASGEPEVRTWVRGRELIHGLYEHDQHSLPALVEAADEAASINATPGLGTGSVHAARAQALALMGRAPEATQALGQLSDVFERLPDRVTTGSASAYTWSEARLRHVESFVYTYLGNVRRAEAAHDRAIAQYIRLDLAGCAQVRLHQALTQIHRGDIGEGVQHATHVVSELPTTWRVGMVLAIAGHVVNAVPENARDRSEVVDLRRLLIPPAADRDATLPR